MASPTRTISVRIPESLAKALDVLAEESGLSVSVLTRRAVEEYYEKICQTGKIELHYSIDVPLLEQKPVPRGPVRMTAKEIAAMNEGPGKYKGGQGTLPRPLKAAQKARGA